MIRFLKNILRGLKITGQMLFATWALFLMLGGGVGLPAMMENAIVVIVVFIVWVGALLWLFGDEDRKRNG